MISDIVYDKLVNLVNDNIKKVSMWILIISGFLAFIAVLLINSSLRLSIHPIDLSLKLCKWWVQQNHLSENHL
jgi:uncharacterized membrane protein